MRFINAVVFISFLPYERFDFYFRTDTLSDKFFPGKTNIYNLGQNIWNKLKKSSKVQQDQKTLKSASG